MKFESLYILYIYIRYNEVIKMAIANLNTIDKHLVEIYENQTTTNVTNADSNYENRSQALFDQMQMIAYNNKMFLKL